MNRRWAGAVLLVFAVPAAAWDDRHLTTPVVVDGRTVRLPEFAIYLMPAQRFDANLRHGEAGTVRYRDVAVPTGTRLQAPAEPGRTLLEIEHTASGERTTVHVFTLVPAIRVDAEGALNGYRLGEYPSQPLRGLDIYRPPAGFVEVTEDNADTKVSPNFRLGQFVSKQDQGYPRYVVLQVNLLLKLEQILRALNHQGHETAGLVIMSGYRTPWYNKAIGNVAYSRHVWGGAADIYIDERPADGRMDDLNGDGKVDRSDARWLADFVNAMSQRGEFGPRVGGLGVYGSNAAHGPFIHVDVRGTRARW